MIKIFNLGSFGTTIELDSSNFDRGMSQAEGKTQSFSSKLGRFGKNVGIFAAGAVTGILGAVGAFSLLSGSLDGAISRYDTLNNFPRVLQMLGFDAESSKKAIDRLSNGIDGLPTTLDSVASTTQRIAGMTGDLDGAVETTLALNNAFLASGASSADAERGLTQYVQMLSKGQVDMQSWRSLQETMPVALNKTAEAFGMTGASAQNDLYDALRDGHITFDEFNGKLVELSEATGGFADMAKESTGGIATSWQNMKTAITKGLTDTIAAVDEALGGEGSISGIIDGFKTGIQGAFSFIVDIIPPVVEAISFVGDAIQGIINWFKELGSQSESSFSGIWEAVQFYFGALEEYWTEIFTSIGTIITEFVEFVIPYIQEFLTMFQEFWQENGEKLMESASTTFNTLRETVETVLNAIWEIIQTILGLVLPFIQEQLEKIYQFWSENGQKIMGAVQNVFSFIQGVIEFVMPIIVEIIKGAWDIITAVFGTAIDIVMGLIDYFASMLTGDFEGMKESSIKIFEALWDGIKGIVEGAWNLLSDAFGALWDNISGWFTDLKDDAFDWGKNMISGFIEGMKDMGADVAKAAGDVVKEAGEFLKFWSPAKKGEGRYIVHWGRNMIDGFLDGVRQESSKAGKVIDDMMKSISPRNLDYSINASGNGTASIGSFISGRGRNLPYGGNSSSTTTSNDNHYTYNVDVHVTGSGTDKQKVETTWNDVLNESARKGFKFKRKNR